MSLTRLTPGVAELGEPAAPPPPPEEPGPRPPSSKRLRAEEPGGVSAAAWRLPVVPRVSELEKEWALPPRPFQALLVSADALFRSPADLRVEEAAGGKHVGNLRRQNSFETEGGSQPPPSGSFDSGLRAPRRSPEAGPWGEVSRAPRRGGPQAEAAQLRPGVSACGARGLRDEGGKQYPVQGRDSGQRGNSYRERAESPWLDIPFSRETKPAWHEIKTRCKADSVTPPSEKESNISASKMLKMSKSQNRPGLTIADASFLRAGSTGGVPGLPTELKSERPPVCSKGRAKKKNDENETPVENFTNIHWPPHRPNVKKRKLPDDEKIVDAENTVRARKADAAGSRRSDRGAASGLRGPEESFPVKLQTAGWKEAETCLDVYRSARSEKCQSENYTIRRILRKSRKHSWVTHNYKTKRQNMRKTGEKLNLLQFSEIALLSEDYYHTKAMNTREEQPQLLTTGALGSQRALLRFFWVSGKGENSAVLQLRYYTSQKGFHLGNVFENFITERFYFHKSVSASEEGNNSISAWHGILKRLKQTDVQNLVIRNINVNRRINVLSIYLQTSVSKPLNIILKTNIASLLSNFDSLTGTGNDSKLEGCIFKWVMPLNYLENITVENHLVDLGRTLTFSIPSGDSMKPMLEGKNLFKMEQVFEEFEERPINSFSVTTKNIVLMDFDDMDEISLTKEISYKGKTCPEQVTNVKNWAPCSTNAVKIHVNSLPQFIQNTHEYINADFYEINMHNKKSDAERKLECDKMSSFNFKCIFEDVFHVRQQAKPTSRCTKHTEQTDAMILTQARDFGSLLRSAIEAKNRDLILKKEGKVTAQSLTRHRQVHKDTEIGKGEENSFDSMGGMLSKKPVSLMSKKGNVEETKYVNQNNLTGTNEYESILRESELANSQHFYPQNDSTECVKHQFGADLSEGDGGFQGLTAERLSEAMTIANDFEMKSKFDLVLKELHMFHEISKENEILSSVKTNNGHENYFRENNDVEETKTKIKKDLKMGTVNKICASSLLCDAAAGPNRHKRHQRLFKWEAVPRNREQEVPNEYPCLGPLKEEFLYSTSEEDGETPSPKRPALFSDEFKEENVNYLLKGGSNFSHGISRVLPLKTCSRPIRVGLSRRAKLKQLHPYLK
ncbi:PREDICTED: RAD51-associated protein 2 [Miniopterus natalensis]|uniref:RAD51-associated protein 2 n=1 Tax=Miniopterus natalensis TaxID=291302 RepID=UPI0007A70B68|nr:PREDICTED: RAD51-associated protein 2 [Miniopterus natalensis]